MAMASMMSLLARMDMLHKGAAYVIYGGSDFATSFGGNAASDRAKLGDLGADGFRVVGDEGTGY